VLKADLIQTILDADPSQVQEDLEALTVSDLELMLSKYHEVSEEPLQIEEVEGLLQLEEGVAIYHNGRKYTSKTPDVHLPEDFKKELIAKGQIRKV